MVAVNLEDYRTLQTKAMAADKELKGSSERVIRNLETRLPLCHPANEFYELNGVIRMSEGPAHVVGRIKRFHAGKHGVIPMSDIEPNRLGRLIGKEVQGTGKNEDYSGRKMRKSGEELFHIESAANETTLISSAP